MADQHPADHHPADHRTADFRADRRQVLRALLLGAAGLAVPAGCGVPSSGAPVVDGNGPSYNSIGGANVKPPSPADTSDPTDLVKLFLRSVSGRVEDNARAKAKEQAQEFMTKAAADSWAPDDKILLVRVGAFSQSTGDNEYQVTFTMRQVGMLSNLGDARALPAGAEAEPVQVVCSVGANQDIDNKSGASRLITRVQNLPHSMVLDADALEASPTGPGYFQPALIYFWDSGRRDLVPDLRYLPLVGSSSGQQLTELVTWLANGPSLWLSSAVVGLPSGTTVPANVVPKDTLVVNLAGANLQNQNADLHPITKQLRATLAPFSSLPVQLQLAAQPQPINDTSNYHEANLADLPAHPDDPEMYCIVNGVVRPVNGLSAPPAVINGVEQNKSVVAAALSRDKRMAALVRSDAPMRMLIGTASDSTAAPAYVTANLRGAAWSRPFWLPVQPGQPYRVLVAVDGALYQVAPDGTVTPVSTSATVRTFAVGPDGHRLAWLDTNGGIWVAPMQNDAGAVSVGTPRALSSGLAELTGIAWSRLERVVVSGKDGASYAICEISIDGVLYSEWDSRFIRPIASLAGYPRPISLTMPSGPGRIRVLAEIGGSLKQIRQHDDSPLELMNSPTASPSATAATTPSVHAPFFLD